MCAVVFYCEHVAKFAKSMNCKLRSLILSASNNACFKDILRNIVDLLLAIVIM